MGKNTVRKTFHFNDTWVCPAGVNNVRVTAIAQNGPTLLAGAVTTARFTAIDSTGAIYASGSNSNGELGDNTAVAKSSPVLVVGSLRWTQVYRAQDQAFAIDTDNNAYSWGQNFDGALGDNTITNRSSPVPIVGGLKFRQIAAHNAGGSAPTLALDLGGNLYSWGRGYHGDGTAITTRYSSPVSVVSFANKLVQVFVGSGGPCVIDTAGQTYIWGDNSFLQVGVAGGPYSTPVLFPYSLRFRQIGGGAGHFLGLTESGLLYAWGRNSAGQLGDGTTNNSSSPVLVLGNKKWRYLVPTQTSTASCAIDDEGNIYAWGSVNVGGIAGPNPPATYSSPVIIPTSGLAIATASFINNNIAMVTLDGRAFTMGLNANGGLGDGTTTTRSSPVAVLGNMRFRTLQQQTVNEYVYAVTPGVSYSVNVLNPSFDNLALAQPPFEARYAIVLEYDA